MSSLQPVKFSTFHKEHTLPDIQIHGLLTIDIPRKKCLLLETIIPICYFPMPFMVLMVNDDRASFRDINIVEIPVFKQRAKQNKITTKPNKAQNAISEI